MTKKNLGVRLEERGFSSGRTGAARFWRGLRLAMPGESQEPEHPDRAEEHEPNGIYEAEEQEEIDIVG